MTLAPTQTVFELVLARPVVTAAGEHESLVHLWWRAPEQGARVVQVYVDGRLVDVSSDVAQRELWLEVDRVNPTRGHRIELLALDAADAGEIWEEHRDYLRNWEPPAGSEAQAALLRDERLEVNSRIVVKIDGVHLDESPVWDSREHRGGFGALFGVGDFGRDSATGLGLGWGELGMGPLGLDATAWRWRREDLPTGEHELSFAGTNANGIESTQVLEQQVTIDALADPARTLAIDEAFVLTWER